MYKHTQKLNLEIEFLIKILNDIANIVLLSPLCLLPSLLYKIVHGFMNVFIIIRLNVSISCGVQVHKFQHFTVF